MPSTKCLPDGTVYKVDPIGYSFPVKPGDQFVFTSLCTPPKNTHIHETIVTAYDVSEMGGIAIYENNGCHVHFNRECFHEIIELKEVDMSGFDDIFA